MAKAPVKQSLIGELGISPNASTGSDLFDTERQINFGDISVGGNQSWVAGLVRDAAVGIAVALAARWAWQQLGGR